MIQYLERDDKKYPFLFSMRAVFNFMNSNQIDYIEDASAQVSLDYDKMLKLFQTASETGAKKADSDLSLSADQIEDLIDEDPSIFMELQDMFNQSSVMKSFSQKTEQNEKSGSDKKK